jgi:transglutaminase-like putative cysteine protease
VRDSHRLLQVHPHSVPFVDHDTIDWEQVRSSHYWIYQRFRYEYPGPVHNLHQRLMVVPSDRHGDQHLCGHKLRVSVADANIGRGADHLGNPFYYFDLPYVDQVVDFEVWVSIERNGDQTALPLVPAEMAAFYLEPTRLTTPDAALEAVARQLAESSSNPWQLAERINSWVFGIMGYTGGVTNVATTAAEALALRQGLCQDYSHIMLTLCRLVGLPARYVSGHLLGEGASHAWVEVLLPGPDARNLVAVAFDPTNHCRGGWRHITVAVGRDYNDVSPTSGYFTAPYGGQLISSKRAGLITVEYFDGTEVSVDENELVFLEEERWVA